MSANRSGGSRSKIIAIWLMSSTTARKVEIVWLPGSQWLGEVMITKSVCVCASQNGASTPFGSVRRNVKIRRPKKKYLPFLLGVVITWATGFGPKW